MTLIKICGITNPDDASAAARLGVDMLGFVFYPQSPRYLRPSVARAIVRALPAPLGKIGVFVNEKEQDVRAVAREAGLTGVQFHGDESPDYCARFAGDFTVIKALCVRDRRDLARVNDYSVDFVLFDTRPEDGDAALRGGTGRVFDWKILKDFEVLKPVFLSGGLTGANVTKAIRELAPFGVDVSTGVEESPGKKSPGLMAQFVQHVRDLE